MHAVIQLYRLVEIEFQRLHVTGLRRGWNVKPEVPQKVRNPRILRPANAQVKQAVVILAFAVDDEMLPRRAKIRGVSSIWIGRVLELSNTSIIAGAPNIKIIVH